MTYTFRPATEDDVAAISALISDFAGQNLMLPRSQAQVRAALNDFLVAEQDGQLAGCGSLVALTPALAEVRSLAVARPFAGNGLGSQIVSALLDVARTRGLDHVCALTLRPNLFQRLGFQVVDRWDLTPKIWSECIFCPKFHRCDEVAVLMNLTEKAQQPADPPWWRPFAQHAPLPVLRLLAPFQA